jgi:hypothetical protein
MGAKRNAYILVVKMSKGRERLHGRLRRRWEDNIKKDLMKTTLWGCELDLSGSGLGPSVSSYYHDNGSFDSIKDV